MDIIYEASEEFLQFLDEDEFEDTDVEEAEAAAEAVSEPAAEPVAARSMLYDLHTGHDFFRLGPHTLYFYGFVIEEKSGGNQVVMCGKEYRKRNKKVVEKLGDRWLNPLDKNVRLANADMFNIVPPKNMVVDGVEVMGTKVALGNLRYIIVYASKVEVRGSNFSMRPNFEGQPVVSRGSVLNQYFGDIDFGDEFQADAVTSKLVDEGAEVFKYCYNKIKGAPRLATYTGSSVAFRDGGDRFIRRLEADTLSRYARHFGRYLSLLDASRGLAYCEGQHGQFTVDCGRSTELVAGDITKFIKEQCYREDTSLCEVLIAPLIFNFQTNQYFSISYITTILDAIKYMIKVSLFVELSDKEFAQFVTRPGRVGLYDYIETLYVRIYKELAQMPALRVHSVEDGVVEVENVRIDKEYIRKVYTSAVFSYKENYQCLCEVLGQSRGIDDAYSHFVKENKPDYKSVGLVSDIKDNKFFEKSDRQAVNDQVVRIIDEMTKLLFVIMYVSSANTFRGLELSVINIAASQFVDRNVLFRHGCISVVTSFGKNRKFDIRERYYSPVVSRLIINHVLLLKPLYLSIVGAELDEVTLNFHRIHLFSLSTHKLVNNDHYYRKVAALTNENVKYVVKMRYLRQAISYMVRYYLNMTLVNRIIEKAQGHHWMSADNSYGNTGGWDRYHSATILLVMYKFFAIYQKYVGIDLDQNCLVEVCERSFGGGGGGGAGGLETEDIDAAKKECGYQEKQFVQDKLIQDICMSGTRSRAVVAPTGFGKTYLFLVPILAYKMKVRKEGGKRRVSFLVLPYNVVAVEFEKRMSKYVNVLGVRNLAAFDYSIDLVVGTVESLTKLHVRDFFLNFAQNHGAECQLYLGVIDEAQVLIEENEFRRLSRVHFLILRSFEKIVSLGATLPRNFATEMEEKLLAPKVYNAVVREPNEEVYMESKFVSEDEERAGYLVGVVKQFLVSHDDGIIFVYFSNLETLRGISQEFEDAVVILSETRDIAQAHEDISNTRVVLATKAASVGLDIPAIRSIIFYETLAAVPEAIQVIGRLRGKPLYVLFLSADAEISDGALEVSECFKRQTCDFYGLEWRGHRNCCGQPAESTRDIVEQMRSARVEVCKRQQVAEVEAEESEIERAKFKLGEINERIRGVEIDKLYIWFGFYLTTLEDSPVVRAEGVCQWCFMSQEGCSATWCERRETVHLCMACRVVFGGMSEEEVCRAVQHGHGGEQLKWFLETDVEAMAMAYDRKLLMCSFVDQTRIKGGIDVGKLNAIYEKVLKAISKFEPGEWVLKVVGGRTTGGTVLIVGDSWDEHAKRSYFHAPATRGRLCGDCGSLADGHGECIGREAMCYFYAVFADSSYRHFRGDIKVFNHWMRALMRAQIVNLHQHVLVAVYQELKKKKRGG